jgi:SAM-dependent methyltransferase
MTQAAEIQSQKAYHLQMFASLYQWDTFWGATLDLIGDENAAVQLAIDQLGHFGPNGVAMVAERLVKSSAIPLRRVVELGSGFGGALRHMGRELRARNASPSLIGVEFVAGHCNMAAEIGRTIKDNNPLIIQADVRCLPLASASVDAVFAAGSLSHFSQMEEVLAECHRVLLPGGVLVFLDEVSLRLEGTPEPGEAFLQRHPPEVFHATTPQQRRVQVERAGLTIEAFEPLLDWAVSLLRQRVRVMRFLGHCAIRMYGAEPCERIIGTLTSAADEYERGTIQPALVVARRLEG